MSKTTKSRWSRLLPKFLRGDKSSKTEGGIDSKSPHCFIHFLDDSHHQIQIKGSWKGSQVQEKVCELLGLHEKDYFGLRFIDTSGQTHWLDGSKSLSSQFKACQPPHKLYFGVKFYSADPCKLREEITRYLFFLQVKQDILQGRLPVTFDEAGELCSYAVQSELGDFDPRQHIVGYVSEFCFVPNQSEELERRIGANHRRLVGLVPVMAEYRYLDKVKWLDMYGVDLHPVMGEGSVEYFLGLTPTGIVVYKNKNKVGNYFWPRINKVTFKGKIFIVKVRDKNNEEHVYAFELPRKTACKHLWKCCVEHHAFFRLNQTQERSSREKRVLRSVSTNRRSGRSERQAVSDNLSRSNSSVVRLPSRRQARRISSDSRLNSEENYESQYNQDTGMVTMVMRPEQVRAPRHRSLPELQGHESPRSTKSAPWETNFDYGLYTHGRESPQSERSNKMREQRSRAINNSDSESGVSQRRKYFPNRRGSDNDSDASMTRRRRRDIDSDSASDVSSRYPASHGNKSSAFPVLYPFHDKENRPNGSIPSLHSAPAGEAKQRRRRRRSKSPGKRPPDELKQHFDFEMKDNVGMSTEELKEIPFVNVQTKASLFKLKYSPKLRQKVKAAKQKSFGTLDQNRNQVISRQSSAPLADAGDGDMSVHSQPIMREGRDHESTVYNYSEVGNQRAAPGGRPHSFHPPASGKPRSDRSNPPLPRITYRASSDHSDSRFDSNPDIKLKNSVIDPSQRPKAGTSGGDISFAHIPPELSYNPSQSYASHPPQPAENISPHQEGSVVSQQRSRPNRDTYAAVPSSRSPHGGGSSDNHYSVHSARSPQDSHYAVHSSRSAHENVNAAVSSHHDSDYAVPQKVRPGYDSSRDNNDNPSSSSAAVHETRPSKQSYPPPAPSSSSRSDHKGSRSHHSAAAPSSSPYSSSSHPRSHHQRSSHPARDTISHAHPDHPPPARSSQQSSAHHNDATNSSGGRRDRRHEDGTGADRGSDSQRHSGPPDHRRYSQGARDWGAQGDPDRFQHTPSSTTTARLEGQSSRSGPPREEGHQGQGNSSSYYRDSSQPSPYSSQAPQSSFQQQQQQQQQHDPHHHQQHNQQPHSHQPQHSNVSFSSLTSPPQNYRQHHNHHHQQQHQQPSPQQPPPPARPTSSMAPYGDYQPSHNSYHRGPQSGGTIPRQASSTDQRYRPRSYGQVENDPRSSAGGPQYDDDHHPRNNEGDRDRSLSFKPDEGQRSSAGGLQYDRDSGDRDRSRPYGQDAGQRSRGSQGEGQRSRLSFHEERSSRAPRPSYQGNDYRSPSGYQQHNPPSYQAPSQPYRQPSPQPPYPGTPPRYQGGPPRGQQGTPPKQQQQQAGGHSVSGTPPRHQQSGGDPGYSQGLLSVHARQQSEGSSSQASVLGGGHYHRSPRPSPAPAASDRHGNRNAGNSLTSDQARVFLRSSTYNPDLCTEL